MTTLYGYTGHIRAFLLPYVCASAFLAGSLVSAGQSIRAEDAGADPGAIQEHREKSWEQFLGDEERGEEKVDPEIEGPDQKNTSPDKADGQETLRFRVKRFEVSESELLTREQIERIIRPYENRTLTEKQIRQVLREFNRLYAEKGHPTARAFLASEKITNGVVKIRLVESKLGKLKIEGAEQLRRSFIRAHLDDNNEKGETLSIPELEKELIRFNRLNESNLRAKLAPGAAFGTTDIELDVAEPDAYQLSLFADNSGRKTVGRLRTGAYFKAANVIGRSDPLSVIADWSRGSVSHLLSYSVPLTSSGLRFETSWSDSEIEVIEEPYEHLDITGDFQELTAGLLYPFYVNAQSKWSAYTRFSRSWSESYTLGIKQQDLQLDMYSAGVSGSVYDRSGRWYTDHSLNRGTDEEHVFYYDGSLTRWQRLGGEFTLRMTGAGQYAPADRSIPASEQFQIGGANTVRGFSEGALGGKSGYYLSLELRRPLVRSAPGLLSNGAADSIEGFVFLDHGGAFPYRGEDGHITENDFLTGAGIGARFNISDYMTGRVSLGFPLDQNEHDPDPRSPWIHFGIQAHCF